jgi:hypothetical protein
LEGYQIVETSVVSLDIPGILACILFGLALLLPTIRSTLVSIFAGIFNLARILPTFLSRVTGIPPILPSILPPVHALRLRVTLRLENDQPDGKNQSKNQNP